MRFSVIVPVYGVERYIHKCVDSILTQSFGDFELILVDDGSPDNCPAICDRYAAADVRVRVIHKPNGRLVSARRAGVIAAQGEYLCYVDGDDWVAENWLETIARRIGECPEKPDMVVFGAVKAFPDHEEEIRITVAEGYYDKARLEEEVYPYLLSDRRRFLGTQCLEVYAWNKAYQRELLKAHYCREERITRNEDFAFTAECAVFSHSICICWDKLYYYNKMNETSNTSKYTGDILYSYCLSFQYMKDRLYGLYDCIDAQMNDSFIQRIALALEHELKHHPSIPEAAATIHRQLKETDILRFVTPRGLPFRTRILCILLKFGMVRAALLGCRLSQLLSDRR